MMPFNFQPLDIWTAIVVATHVVYDVPSLAGRWQSTWFVRVHSLHVPPSWVAGVPSAETKSNVRIFSYHEPPILTLLLNSTLGKPVTQYAGNVLSWVIIVSSNKVVCVDIMSIFLLFDRFIRFKVFVRTLGKILSKFYDGHILHFNR